MDGEMQVVRDEGGRYLAPGLVLTDDAREAIRFPGAHEAVSFAARYSCGAERWAAVTCARPAA